MMFVTRKPNVPQTVNGTQKCVRSTQESPDRPLVGTIYLARLIIQSLTGNRTSGFREQMIWEMVAIA